MELLEACEFIVDCPHSTAKDEGKGYPLVRTPNVGKGRLILDGVHRVSEEVYNLRIARAIPSEDDLILAREAPVGNVAIITKDQKVCLGQRVVLIRPNKEKAYPQFLVYYLLSPNIQHKLKNTANGAVVSHLNVADIRRVDVELPSLNLQKKIGDILSSLDSKIETNNKINAKLEEMAQALFKSWFVDFEPFKDKGMVESELGMIPEGWRVGKLGDIADITSGKRPPMKQKEHSKVVNIPLVGAADVMVYTNDVLYETPILVIGRVGTHGIVQRWKDKCWPSDNTLVISSNCYEFVFQILSNIDYKSLNRGSTQPLITQTDIKNTKIILPPECIIDKYENVVGKIMKAWYINKEESSRLSLLRDTLLPKLMSGEINLDSLPQ